MTWGFLFALLKRFYSFTHKEILNLTQDQIYCYVQQIPEVMYHLGEAEKKEEKKIQREDVVILIKQLGHKIPEEMK